MTIGKNKILFITTNYPQFLGEFYKKNPKLEKLSYKKNKELLMKEFFGSSNFYSNNIKKYGWVTDDVIANDWDMQSKWAAEHNIKVMKDELFFYKYIPEYILIMLGLRNWVKRILLAQIEDFKPDIVYMHHLGLLNSSDINKIKKSARLVVGQIASPLPINKKPLYSYDIIFSSFPHYVQMFKRMGIKSEYLPWCAEDTLVKKIKPSKRIYNVTVIGGFSPYHSRGNKVFENLASSVKVDFWGYREHTLSPSSPILKNFHGQAWGKEMYKIFSKSKIVINRHINVSQGYANNLRMFEATTMGALLITDHKKNMNEFFVVGKEVVTYRNAKELIRKVKYYLAHPKEARKIAEKGQKRTLKDHTYKIRMQELDKILRNHL